MSLIRQDAPLMVALLFLMHFGAANADCNAENARCQAECKASAQSSSGGMQGLRGGRTNLAIGMLGVTSGLCLSGCESQFDRCQEEDAQRQAEQRQEAERARQAAAERQRVQDQASEQSRQRAAQQAQYNAQMGKAKKWMEEGFEHYKRKEYQDAADFFEAALKLDSNHPEGHYHAALTQLALKQAKKAEEHALRYIELEPESPYVGKLHRSLPGLEAAKKQQDEAKRQAFEARYNQGMVTLPAGSFVLGSPDNELGRKDDEGPQRLVTLKKFSLSKTEVTRGQFAVFVSETGYDAGNSCRTMEYGRWEDRSSRNWRNPGYSPDDNHPVVCVSWRDAQAYVQWLARKTGQPYRLPSEAEWEYAARAGSKASRHWGDGADVACTYANVADQTKLDDDLMWTDQHACLDGYWYTSPVGSFKPNAFGLLDMLGNAWEWVDDCWGETRAGAPVDGRCSVRGGGWNSSPDRVRSAARGADPSLKRSSSLGFRVAKTLP